ncbi:hypothetical protein M3553_23300, partial [Bacillus subtilis]|nr:hypothetical protein [Bacillus subtilis]
LASGRSFVDSRLGVAHEPVCRADLSGGVLYRECLARLRWGERDALPPLAVLPRLEALGLMKVDVLALGMLSALHLAFDLRTARRGPARDGEPFTLKHNPQDDKATYDMICSADTVGVFTIESRAQMS